MPTVLRELMRHADISTTMKYYVGQNAEATADALWAAVGNTLGNTPSANKKRDAKSTANSKYRREDLNLHDLAVTGF